MNHTNPQQVIDRLRRRLWIERGVFLLVLLGLGLAWLYPLVFPSVWAVYVNNRPVVALRDRSAVEGLLQAAKQEAGGDAAFVQQVRVDRAAPSQVEITDAATAAEKLDEVLKLRAERAVIYVDGLPVVALPDQASADEVLYRVKAALAKDVQELEVPPRFREAVEVRMETAEQDVWGDVETAFALLCGEGGEETRKHTVASGQTASAIAAHYDLSLAKLKQANPGVNLARLKVGQSLSLGAESAPLVTVITEGEETQTVTLSYKTQIRKSPQMYQGKRLLKQAGRPGRQQVTYKIRRENGVVVDRSLVGRKTLTAPRTKIVVHGVKPRP